MPSDTPFIASGAAMRAGLDALDGPLVVRGVATFRIYPRPLETPVSCAVVVRRRRLGERGGAVRCLG
ncbi:MAG: hypothetical protein KIT17_22955 [Rubrivivax sp.]|nr:hypothetical protein [Rubrivivax sp.]